MLFKSVFFKLLKKKENLGEIIKILLIFKVFSWLNFNILY